VPNYFRLQHSKPRHQDRLGAREMLIREQTPQRTRGIVAKVLEERGRPRSLDNRHLVSAGENVVAGERSLLEDAAQALGPVLGRVPSVRLETSSEVIEASSPHAA
jgi:hypothetical protein